MNIGAVVLLRMLPGSLGVLLAMQAVAGAQAISGWNVVGERGGLPAPIRPAASELARQQVVAPQVANHQVVAPQVAAQQSVHPTAVAQHIATPGAAPHPGLPSTIRPVKHTVVHPDQKPSDHHTRALVGSPTVASRGNPSLHSHQLLRAPSDQPRHGTHGTGSHQPATWLHWKKQHHHVVQPPAALLPESNSRAVWKAPYSYGHFGASGTRHWSRQHGYRDRITEWRLR